MLSPAASFDQRCPAINSTSSSIHSLSEGRPCMYSQTNTSEAQPYRIPCSQPTSFQRPWTLELCFGAICISSDISLLASTWKLPSQTAFANSHKRRHNCFNIETSCFVLPSGQTSVTSALQKQIHRRPGVACADSPVQSSSASSFQCLIYNGSRRVYFHYQLQQPNSACSTSSSSASRASSYLSFRLHPISNTAGPPFNNTVANPTSISHSMCLRLKLSNPLLPV